VLLKTEDISFNQWLSLVGAVMGSNLICSHFCWRTSSNDEVEFSTFEYEYLQKIWVL